MKLRLPQALIASIITVAATALPLAITVGTGALVVAATGQAQATIENATYTSTGAKSGTWTNGANLSTSTTGATAINAPSNTDPTSLNLSNYTGTLTIEGTGAIVTAYQSGANANKPVNGGNGGRITFTGTAPSTLEKIVICNGIEANLTSVQGTSLKFEFNDASFYVGNSATINFSMRVGSGGVRFNGGSGQNYTFASTISGTGDIVVCTDRGTVTDSYISVTGDTSGYSGTYTQTRNVTEAAVRWWVFGNGTAACPSGHVGGNVGTSALKAKAEYKYSGNYTVDGALYVTNLKVSTGNATFAGGATTLENRGVHTTDFTLAAGASATFSGNAESDITNAFTTEAGSTLGVASGSTLTAGGLITLTAGADASHRTTVTNAGTLVLTSGLTTANNTAFSNTGTLRLGDGAALTLATGTNATMSGALELGTGSIIDSAIDFTQSGAVRGVTGSTTSSLIKRGAGNVTITGAISNLSGLTVAGGSLKIQKTTGLELTSVTLNGGELILHETNQGNAANTFGSLTLAADSTITAANHRTRIKVDSLTLNGHTLTIIKPGLIYWTFRQDRQHKTHFPFQRTF